MKKQMLRRRLCPCLQTRTIFVWKILNKVLQAELSPIRERRKYWEQHLDDVYDILKEGSKVAEAKAAQTLHDVRSAMQINYFDDNSLIK